MVHFVLQCLLFATLFLTEVSISHFIIKGVQRYSLDAIGREVSLSLFHAMYFEIALWHAADLSRVNVWSNKTEWKTVYKTMNK